MFSRLAIFNAVRASYLPIGYAIYMTLRTNSASLNSTTFHHTLSLMHRSILVLRPWPRDTLGLQAKIHKITNRSNPSYPGKNTMKQVAMQC